MKPTQPDVIMWSRLATDGSSGGHARRVLGREQHTTYGAVVPDRGKAASGVPIDEVAAATSIGGALRALLREASDLEPDQLPAAVAAAADAAGGRDAIVWLVDLQQRLLLPLRGEGSSTLSSAAPRGGGGDRTLVIEATAAGRCYTTSRPIVADDGDERHVWAPIVDGSDRLGVLSVTVDVDDSRPDIWVELASLTAELLVTKGLYTDSFRRRQRLRPASLAQELQLAHLPPRTFSSPRVGVAGALEPAYAAAGDGFDYALDGDLMHLAIFDAVGHDLRAGIMCAVAMAALRHARRAGVVSPDEARHRVSAALTAEFGDDAFVTGQLGVLDCRTGQLAWVNAGHPEPLHMREGRLVGHLQCEPSTPLGVPGRGGPEARIRLQPGDRVLFLSDGVLEARNADGSRFGDERLGQLFQQVVQDGLGPAETIRRLVLAVLDHERAELQDDATLLLLQYVPDVL